MNYLLSTAALSVGHEPFYSSLGISEVAFNLESLALVNPSHSPPSHLLRRRCWAENSSQQCDCAIESSGSHSLVVLDWSSALPLLGEGSRGGISENLPDKEAFVRNGYISFLNKALFFWEGFLEKAAGRKKKNAEKFKVCISLPFKNEQCWRLPSAFCKLQCFLPVFEQCLHLLQALLKLQDISDYFRIPDSEGLTRKKKLKKSVFSTFRAWKLLCFLKSHPCVCMAMSQRHCLGWEDSAEGLSDENQAVWIFFFFFAFSSQIGRNFLPVMPRSLCCDRAATLVRWLQLRDK